MQALRAIDQIVLIDITASMSAFTASGRPALHQRQRIPFPKFARSGMIRRCPASLAAARHKARMDRDRSWRTSPARHQVMDVGVLRLGTLS
jgi:hypothetical protein